MAKTITNHRARPLLYFYELPAADQKRALKEYHTYMNEEKSMFFRYKGDLYILDDFVCGWGEWDGYLCTTVWGGINIKFKEGQKVVVGRYFSD